MKIYILLDEYFNSEHHCDFVDAFDNAEAVLKYIAENQSDGHKFKYEVREFNNPTNPIDYPCTNPHYDYINCPRQYGYGGTFSSNSGDDTKPNDSCTNVSVNSEFLEHTDGTSSRQYA